MRANLFFYLFGTIIWRIAHTQPTYDNTRYTLGPDLLADLPADATPYNSSLVYNQTNMNSWICFNNCDPNYPLIVCLSSVQPSCDLSENLTALDLDQIDEY